MIGSDDFNASQPVCMAGASRVAPQRSRMSSFDDSLEVDMPSLNDRSYTTLGPAGVGSTQVQAPRSATVRTYSSAMFEDLAPVRTNASRSKGKKTSKHFPPMDDDDDIVDLDPDAHMSEHPSRVAASAVSADGDDQRKRLNPWAVTKSQSEQRKRLHHVPSTSRPADSYRRHTRPPHTIDLTDSPIRSSGSPLEDVSNRENIVSPSADAEQRSRKAAQPKSILDHLGVCDARGRPTKGAVSGTKVRRRA